MILAIVDDLLFRTKIQTAAAGLEVLVRTVSQMPDLLKDPAGAPRLIIVDLGLSASDPIQAIATARRLAPDVPIVGFGSHVETQLMAQATAAGCTTVMPRSLFVQRLPDLLAQA